MLKLIKTRVVAGILAGLAVGMLVVLAIVNRVYERNLERELTRSLQATKAGFASIEGGDVKMMSAVLATLAADNEIREAFKRRDRDGLAALTGPLFNQLKREHGITLWHFLDGDGRSFLRVHEPKRFGDIIDHATLKRAVEKRASASGMELGKMGFALRVAAPYLDKDGTTLGYLELGEEIDYFSEVLKKYTGAEVVVLASKKLLDHGVWTSMRTAHQARDDWEDEPEVVLVSATTTDARISTYTGSLDDIPDTGKIIERLNEGGHTFLRAILPLVDAADRQAGGVLIMQDATEITNNAKSTRTLALFAFLLAAVLLCLVTVVMLQRLVFARLTRIIAAATRLAGGAFEEPLSVSGADEVGQIEQLFEQLRVLFTNTVRELEAKSRRD